VGVIGAIGVSATTNGESGGEDFVEHLFIASTHDFLMLFTSRGRAFAIRVHELPAAARTSKGKFIKNFVNLSQGETLKSCVAVREFVEGKFLVMITAQGVIKKTELSQFENIRRSGIFAITLGKDDELIAVRMTSGKDNVLAATQRGKAIHFPEKDVRPMGRSAAGVHGIRLGKNDRVVGMESVDKNDSLLTVTEKGFAKRTKAAEYRLQSRAGMGITNLRVTEKNGHAVGMRAVSDQDDLMVMSTKGMVVRVPVKDIRQTGRAAQGVRVINLRPGDRVATMTCIEAEEAIAEEAKTQAEAGS
jgi:DNA gyrase subunit A